MLIENTLYPPIKNYQKSLITSKFNASRGSKKHKGLDIGVESGTEVFAPGDGVVMDSDSNRSTCGGFIKIKHNDGIITKYCHLKKVLVKPSQPIKLGQLIGLSGGDLNDPGKGHTTGAHLHFEVMKNGEFLDPEIVFGTNQMINIDQPDNVEYVNKLNTKNDFRTYDLKKIDKFDTYDLIKNENKYSKFNNINEEEEVEDDEINLESDLGNIIKDSFTNKSCKDKSTNVDDGSFVDEYTYRPNSENFCCRFSKCKLLSDSSETCKKIEVLFKGNVHILHICSDKFNTVNKLTKKDELIAKLSHLSDFIDLYVTRGLSTKVKLTKSAKVKDKSSKPSKLSYSAPSKLAQLKTSEKDSFNKPYSFPKTSKKDSFNKPFDLKNPSKSNSSDNFYKLPATSEKNSFSNSKKLPPTSENQIVSKELINEINRIIDIMK